MLLHLFSEHQAAVQAAGRGIHGIAGDTAAQCLNGVPTVNDM